MLSFYRLEASAADRRQELLRDGHSNHLAAELRQPWPAKMPSWWASSRRSGRFSGGRTMAASATIATS